MVLKLDSRVPRVWRTPSSLQFGVDPARVVLHNVTEEEERLLSVLVAGISRSGLDMVAASMDGGGEIIASLLEELRPVMLPEVQEAVAGRPVHIDIVGSGPTVQRLAVSLAEAEQQSSTRPQAFFVAAPPMPPADGPDVDPAAATDIPAGSPAPIERPCDFAIAVDHYVLNPDLYGYWLRRDIPHLPVVFGDGSVSVGPFIEPGSGPCLYCLDLSRTAADPLWPTIQSQLWKRRSGSETPLVSLEVAALVTRMIITRLRDGIAPVATLVRISVADGTVTSHTVLSHSDCGCREVPSAARPGNDLPVETDPGVFLRPPTTRRASASRG